MTLEYTPPRTRVTHEQLHRELVDAVNNLSGGGGGGGAGDFAQVLFLATPNDSLTSSDPITFVNAQEYPSSQGYISIDGGTGAIAVEPGVYSVHLTVSLNIGVSAPPPLLTIEATIGSLAHASPAGFAEVNDVSADFVGHCSATIVATAAGTVLCRYSGSHADIFSGVVTVSRLRDV
jgi:hypothetical protein